MSARPIWFGPPDRRMFGWMHAPLRSSGAVVMCLPLGDESFPAYRAYRLLAEILESLGLAALRFDYSGTGDSAGRLEDVEDVDTWISDAGEAVGLVRAAGARTVVLVGLRAGALLARHAAARYGVDRLVLWDPCETGSGFLREQHLLAATGRAPLDLPVTEPAAGVEIQGALLSERLASSLRNLSLRDPDAPELSHLLLLVRPDRSAGNRVRQEVMARSATTGVAPDQDRFFDVDVWHPFVSDDTVHQIADWCASIVSSVGTVPAEFVAPEGWTTADVASTDQRALVTESPVELGPHRVFGILSAPDPPARNSSPAVALLNMGLDRHTGPSRLWVDLARDWAAHGTRVLRFDLSGIGDSPPHRGRPREIVYPAEAIDDITEAVRFLSPDDPSRVLLVGVCSGAYHAAEAGTELGSRAVFLINPAMPHSDTLQRLNSSTSALRARRAARRTSVVAHKLAASETAVRLAHQLVPTTGWRLLDAVGFYRLAARAFRSLVAAGADVHVLCGVAEAIQFTAHGQSELRRLSRTGRFRFEVDEHLDHTLLRAHSRATVVRALTDYVLGDFRILTEPTVSGAAVPRPAKTCSTH